MLKNSTVVHYFGYIMIKYTYITAAGMCPCQRRQDGINVL